MRAGEEGAQGGEEGGAEGAAVGCVFDDGAVGGRGWRVSVRRLWDGVE